MNVVDSSGWLEFFAGGRSAKYFAPPIMDTSNLLVPAICLFEVFKVVARDFGESEAIQSVAFMKEGAVVDVNERIALFAAQLSLTQKLPMADSLILAISRQHEATLWTQDADFKGLDGVKYFKKT